MKWLVVVAVVAACAGAPRPTKDSKKQAVEAASAELFDAIAHKDVEGIQHYLTEPIELGGLWFFDHACLKQFPGPRKVEAAALPALAKCLATLPMRQSSRTDPLFGVVVATYEPGLEIELAFAYGREDERPHVRFIGFAGRRDLGDALPTVTPAALESRRVTGEQMPALDADADAALKKQLEDLHSKELFAWFKICVGADGRVTSVHPREASSPLLVSTYNDRIKDWQFEPFKLGEQPTPVCMLQRFLYPMVAPAVAEAPGAHEMLPWPSVNATDASLLHIPAKLLIGVGEHHINMNFTLRDQQMVDYTETVIVEGTVGMCIDEQGAVFQTFLLEPTGFSDFDASIQRDIHAWHFKPVVIGGAPTRVCSTVRVRDDMTKLPWFMKMRGKRAF